MPKVYKLSMEGLKKIIAAEKTKLVKEAAAKSSFGPIRDVSKEPKKTKEVEADGYADTLEKEVDYLKAQKVQEAKLIMQLKRLREKMRYNQKKIEESKKQVKPAKKKSR